MLISRQQFIAEVHDPALEDRVSIAFIGMSGAGKSGRGAELAERGSYDHVEVDHLIGKKVQRLLRGYKGDTAAKLGHWFGKPWSKEFPKKEEKYLEIERTVMERCADVSGSILDLTGSAIYHSDEMQAIKDNALIVYLEADDDLRTYLQQTFLERPKAVCWNGLFDMKKKEKGEDAIQRLYPKLLDTRIKLYRQFADVTLDASTFKKNVPKSRRKTVDDLIRAIAAQLPIATGYTF